VLLLPLLVPDDVSVNVDLPEMKSCCLNSIVGITGMSAGDLMSSALVIPSPLQIFL
jgi:hypothetical protein